MAAVDESFCSDEKRRRCYPKEKQPSRSCSMDSSGEFPATSMKSSSKSGRLRRCSFTRKCSRLVREQRARFYIMRRCVTMLICWRDYGDS
ncbi:hypothetical protein SAY87_006879 [Trapa incisa]|uniref:Uncharacterized protein n=1 Tax=Trapa incisa TaxID=236973 RepID=A0AAN7PZA5_9MYRT|nr:hypothetical protein SAY87_006879 [Trapa incisa]